MNQSEVGSHGIAGEILAAGEPSAVGEPLASFETGLALSTESGNAETGYCYLNAGTCPDCAAAMVRLGNCFACPSCGYESCAG